MRLSELTESINYLKDFQATAMKMWIPKYKREYGSSMISSTKDAIYIDEGIGKVQLLKFEKSGLTIAGFEGEETIKYMSDELKFIKAIQKVAKDIDVRPLKNLKALRDNIELREYDTYTKHDAFFTKANKMLMKHRRDTPKIMKDLGLHQIAVKDLKVGDTIYLYETDNLTLGTTVKLPIEKIKVHTITVRDIDEVRVNDDYIVGTYNTAFRTLKESEIAFLWDFFGASSFLADKSRLKTKNDKVLYVKNMIQYEKFLKKRN